MVEQLSSLCRCFGFTSLGKDVCMSGKKVSLTKKKLYNCSTAITSSSELNDHRRHDWTQRKDSKIVIIGAGEAGIHMASILKMCGFTNVLIMEQESTFGGKSLLLDSGASDYIHPNFANFFQLLALYADKDNHHELVPVSTRHCNVVTRDNTRHPRDHHKKKHVFSHGGSGDSDSAEDAMAGTRVQKLNEWVNIHSPEFVIAVKKFIKLHKKIFGSDSRTSSSSSTTSTTSSNSNMTVAFPPRPHDLSMIDMTFMHFLRKHNLEVLVPYFQYNHSLLHCYGCLEEIPAFYGLLWNNVSSMHALLHPMFQQREKLWTLKRGIQRLFGSIIEAQDLSVLYNTQITSINRYLNERKHRICVMYTDKTEGLHGYEKLLECDVLFCASDISSVLPLMSDPTPEEQSAFGDVSAYTLYKTELEYSPQSPIRISRSSTAHAQLDETTDEESAVEDDSKDELLPCHSGGCAMQDVIGKQYTFYPHNLSVGDHDGRVLKLEAVANADSPRFVAHQMVHQDESQCDDEEMEQILMQDLKSSGFNTRNVKILRQNRMRFCPLWKQEAINEGIPWLVKDHLQGRYKTYYIGSSVCFQSLEAVLWYNTHLQKKLQLRPSSAAN